MYIPLPPTFVLEFMHSGSALTISLGGMSPPTSFRSEYTELVPVLSTWSSSLSAHPRYRQSPNSTADNIVVVKSRGANELRYISGITIPEGYK